MALKAIDAARREPDGGDDVFVAAASRPPIYRLVAKVPIVTMPAARKIGVLTFHRCINYGSYWQARCLVEGLRSRGHDAVLLDHESREVTSAEWRCAFQPLLPQRSSRADQRLYGVKVRKFLSDFDQLPQSRPFPLDRPSAMDAVDVVVVGSDEVWNLSHPWYGGRPIFYGDGLNSPRVVSYAASFGNYDAANGLHSPWADRLRDFSAISVRDENSRSLVRAATGEDPALVLDPVLQFPLAATAPAGADGPPYVLVYGHGLPDWIGRQVRSWARTRGCRVISIGYRNDWADEQRLADGPQDFARLMAQAAAVVTNFFHGCVFALINAKPFASVLSAYRTNKVRDLMAAVGAERHLLREEHSPARFADILSSPLDAGIGAAIERLRAASNQYLDRVLA